MFKARPPTGKALASDAWIGFRREQALSVENETGVGRAVILCDHASRAIPSHLAGLGLLSEDLDRHIAWDPGALGIARELSRLIDAPLVAGRISRLVIDTNRDPAMFDSIPARSDATEIPGNAGLTQAERGAACGPSTRRFTTRSLSLVQRKCRERLDRADSRAHLHAGL